MKRLIGVFLFGFLAVTVTSFGAAASVHGLTPEELRLENARNFKEWRESIPDYEKRLYDRVKGINKRVIRVQNLVIGSFVLLLVFNWVFLVLIYRRIGTEGTKAATKPSTTGGFLLTAPNLALNIIRKIIRFIGKFLPPVVIAPDDTPASGSENSNASLR